MSSRDTDIDFIRQWVREVDAERDMAGWKDEHAPKLRAETPELIAITGVSGFFPGAMDVQDFWRHLDNDETLISEIPETRFDWRRWYMPADEDQKAMRTKWGGFIPDITAFDPALFGMLPAEADETDPRQRLLLMSTWRTLEDAGFDPLSLGRTKTGVFIGCEHNEYAQLMRERGFVPKGLFNQADSMISNRISFAFDFAGPSEIVNTMCSGFAVALNRAVISLRAGEIDRAIVGAANIMLTPDLFCALSSGDQLSTTFSVKSFGADADGYVRGEGVGTILIERLSDVRAAHRHAYAAIRHVRVNYNGNASTSIAAPSVDAHTQLILDCYREAGVMASRLAYVEAQGMGLPVADIAEWSALNRALSALHQEQGQTMVPGSCRVSTLKPMTGHMHAASSLGALLKVIHSIRTKKFYKVLGYTAPNPYCDMDGVPCRIVRETEDWEDGAEPRIAGLHSYGSGGNNAHVVVEEIPDDRQVARTPVAPQPFQLRQCWFQTPDCLDQPAAEDLEKQRMLDVIKDVLGLPSSSFEALTPFLTLGVDSLSIRVFVETLNERLSLDLKASAPFNHPTPDAMADHLLASLGTKLNATKEAPPTLSHNTLDVKDRDIAIIGISMRVAGAENHNEFWSNLEQGRCTVADIPADRKSAHVEELAMSKGGFIADIDAFDPLFFGISPREARLMDPRHRLLLQAAYAAIEDSGHSPSSWAGHENGIFIGLEDSDYPLTDQSTITSTHSGTAPARIGYFLDTKGPLLSLSTACSSSLVALHYACESILNGDSEQALAGGCNLFSDPAKTLSTLSRAGDMLSPSGTCHAFDDRANGMVIGEGIGIVVLKRLSDALRDGDAVYGVIKGSGINYDGRTNGLTAPSGGRQQELYQRVAGLSGVPLERIEHIVAHGTGTMLGDPIECNALIDAHRAASDKQGYCALTSVKTNIGHTLAASGVINLIAATLSTQNKCIPATLNYETANPEIALDGGPCYVNTQSRVWDSDERNAAVSAFGHTGTNAHLIVSAFDEGDVRAGSNVVSGPVVIVLSAKSRDRLNAIAERLLHAAGEQKETLSLSDLAYTLQVGRDAMRVRMGFVVHTMDDVIDTLGRFIKGTDTSDVIIYDPDVSCNDKTFGALSGPKAVSALLQWIEQGAFETIVKAWTHGVSIDWNQLYGAARPRRVHLPSYPFTRERYWISTSQVSRPQPELRTRDAVPGTSVSMWLKRLVCEFLDIPFDKLHTAAALETYGLDSLTIGELVTKVRDVFPLVDSTIFFQFSTIEEISDHLCKTYTDTVIPSGEEVSLEARKVVEGDAVHDERSVTCLKPSKAARVRLLVFHPFGFGNRALSWVSRLADDVDVWGVGKAGVTDWDELISALAEDVEHLFDLPVVVWGHSMGAVVAFEVLHRLEQCYGHVPQQFVVSSAAYPELFERLKFVAPFYEITDEMSVAKTEEILTRNHYLVPPESGLPVLSSDAIHADVALCKTYWFDPDKLISAPISMVQANNDILVRDAAVVLRWEQVTTGTCRYEEVEGTHLFFVRPPKGFVDLLASCCGEEAWENRVIEPGVYALKQVYSGTSDAHLFPLSAEPQGYLFYSDDGHMAAHLWHPKRGGLDAGTTTTLKDFMPYVAYSGDYLVEKGIVRHSVFASLKTDLEHKQLDRFIEPDTQGLVLKASPVIMSKDGQYGVSDHQKISWALCPQDAKRAAPPFAGTWRLKGCKGLGRRGFKGQCLVSQDGYISVIAHHKSRKNHQFQNFAMASAVEIEDTLQSCIVWFGRLVHSAEQAWDCDVLVRQTPGAMAIDTLECVLTDNELQIAWNVDDEQEKGVVTTWIRN